MESTLKLDYIDIQRGPQKNIPDYCVIWMHGLGADANDFIPIVPELPLDETLCFRFIFPNAPIRPITINNGYSMRGWYDILTLDRINGEEDEHGLLQSCQAITNIIHQQRDLGIPSDHIFLAGFSQGCAMALMTGLRFEQPLAGIIGLSGYLPLAKQTSTERHTANQSTPIFLAHGTQDSVVKFEFAQLSKEILESLNYAITWRTYPMEHSVCLPEINDIGLFMTTVASKSCA